MSPPVPLPSDLEDAEPGASHFDGITMM